MTQYQIPARAEHRNLRVTVGYDPQRDTYHATVKQNLTDGDAFTYLMLGNGEPVRDPQELLSRISFFADITGPTFDGLIGERLTNLPLLDMIHEAPEAAPPAWLHAHRHAVDLLGRHLARRIQWGEPGGIDQHFRIPGTLTGTDHTATLRFEPDQEPGTCNLQVQVPCPVDSTCTAPAWDRVTNRHELIAAIVHGTAGDPWCDTHHGDPFDF